ncbi:hypothetical protein ECDEC15E_4884, partial [Escherichia coli DEC15E]
MSQRIVQRLFTCQRIVNGGAEFRVIVNGRGNFFQCVQCGWRTVNQSGNSGLNKLSGRNPRGVISCGQAFGAFGSPVNVGLCFCA